MSYEEILEKVIGVFSTITDEEITEDSELMDQLELTSMDVLLMVTNLEGEFGIRVPQKEVRRLATIGDVAKMVERLKG